MEAVGVGKDLLTNFESLLLGAVVDDKVKIRTPTLQLTRPVVCMTHGIGYTEALLWDTIATDIPSVEDGTMMR